MLARMQRPRIPPSFALGRLDTPRVLCAPWRRLPLRTIGWRRQERSSKAPARPVSMHVQMEPGRPRPGVLTRPSARRRNAPRARFAAARCSEKFRRYRRRLGLSALDSQLSAWPLEQTHPPAIDRIVRLGRAENHFVADGHEGLDEALRGAAGRGNYLCKPPPKGHPPARTLAALGPALRADHLRALALRPDNPVHAAAAIFPA
jgi:hypothetical protein